MLDSPNDNQPTVDLLYQVCMHVIVSDTSGSPFLPCPCPCPSHQALDVTPNESVHNAICEILDKLAGNAHTLAHF